VHEVLDRHGVEYSLVWTVGGQPFLTTPGTLVQAVQAAIKDETGLDTELSTTGGTSDGRFIAQICPQVIEMGPPNASIHKIDEHIAVADIEPLKNIYRKTLEQLQRQRPHPRPHEQHQHPLISGNTVAELIASGAQALTAAGVAFGHGTATAEDEAAWLVLWKLGLPWTASSLPARRNPWRISLYPLIYKRR
jgi:hypothetical protein